MKIRRSILWFCFGIVAIILVVISFSKRPAIAPDIPSPYPPSGPTTQPASQPKASPGASKGQFLKTSVSQSAVATAPQKSKGERTLEILSTQNDVPIDFYGKLEDQFGKPVVGAEIKGNIVVYNGQRAGTDHFSTASDVNGLFEFHGRGEQIGMMPHKEGYALASLNGGGKYSHLYPEDQRVHSDPNNPVVIKMWKLQGAEHLIHFQTEFAIPLDGTTTTFDLQTGERVQSAGDIIVSVKSSPIPNIREQYDWQVTIKAVAGGLISCSDDFEQKFQAPDSGYQPEFDIIYQKNMHLWTSRFINSFCFTSRNAGCYGKLAIEVISDVVKNGTVPVIINSYVNPSGSRNLEIDPAMVTAAHP